MHEIFMKTALALARRGAGRTSPNPMVGSLVVKEGEVVGRGYHHAAGGPHAEIEALGMAGSKARGATVYVTLEPCCHYGRTPPCTLSLIRAEVKEVVAAMQDPNPVVAGKGLKALRESGISTVCGVLKEKAGELNRAYVKHVTTGLPLVVLKAGMSLDGKISTAGGESRWITGEVARRYVHRLRSTMDAVMVGTETLLRDDPRLTARPPRGKGRDPLRVVVDSKLRLPLTARIFDPRSEAGVVIATTGTADGPKAEKLKATPGVTLLELDGPDGRVDLPSLMKHLGAMGVTSLMLEGGAEINASMLEAGLVDKVMLFMSNMIIGGRSAPGVVGGGGTALLSQSVRLQDMKLKRYGQDLLVEGDIA